MHVSQFMEDAFSDDKDIPVAKLAGDSPKKSIRARERAGSSNKSAKRAQPSSRTKRSVNETEKQDPAPGEALAGVASKHKTSAKFLCVAKDGIRLHCNLCGNDFGTRANVVARHMESEKHQTLLLGKTPAPGAPKVQSTIAVLYSKEAQIAREEAAVVAREAAFQEKSERAHRLRVMDAWIGAGLPVHALQGGIKDLLEEEREMRLSLGHFSNLSRETVPLLTAKLDKEDLNAVTLGNGFWSCFWDGFSDKDESSLVLGRFCTNDFHLSERALNVRLISGSMTGPNWVRIVDETRRRLGGHVVFSAADGAPTNGIVGETFSNMLSNYFHSFCFSHTLAVAGGKTAAPLVHEWLNLWCDVFKNSQAAREVAHSILDEAVVRKAKVRWFSKLSVIEQGMLQYQRLLPVCHAIEAKGYCEDSNRKLKLFLVGNTANAHGQFAIQMAAFYDINKPFRDACYFLEGSGFLAPFVHQQLLVLKQICMKVLNIDTAHSVLPNATALICNLPGQINAQSVWAQVCFVVCLFDIASMVDFLQGAKCGGSCMPLLLEPLCAP